MENNYTTKNSFGFFTLRQESAYIPDVLLRDIFAQSLGKQYLLDGGGIAAPSSVDEAAYIDPLDEMSPRLAMLVRAANQRNDAINDNNGVASAKNRPVDDQFDYDALLLSDNSPRLSQRDQEHALHSSQWGHHYVTGGHGEGPSHQLHHQSPVASSSVSHHRLHQQSDDVDDLVSVGDGNAGAAAMMHEQESAAAAAAAAAAVSSFRNLQIKSEQTLPAYCNPPNPCPVGVEQQHGCLEEFENTAAFSRDYQAAQECMCDNEHMFICHQDEIGKRNNGDGDYANFLKRQMQQPESAHKNLVAKKFHPQRQHPLGAGAANPYLAGEKLPVAAKKGIRAF